MTNSENLSNLQIAEAKIVPNNDGTFSIDATLATGEKFSLVPVGRVNASQCEDICKLLLPALTPAAESNRGVVLTSANGHFLCTGESAVEVAYMLSNAEAVLHRNKTFQRFEVGDILCDYLEGRTSVEEVQNEFREDLATGETVALPENPPVEASSSSGAGA